MAAFGLSAVIGVGGSIIGGETGGAVYWVTYLGAGIPLVSHATGWRPMCGGFTVIR